MGGSTVDVYVKLSGLSVISLLPTILLLSCSERSNRVFAIFPFCSLVPRPFCV